MCWKARRAASSGTGGAGDGRDSGRDPELRPATAQAWLRSKDDAFGLAPVGPWPPAGKTEPK